jgi:anti-sigma regulatory factor (Ser/Thr protein kinase)
MEAAKPSPDRWRLLSRRLGVSVTTMLLADELISEAEASSSTVTEVDFGGPGRDWDPVRAGNAGDFFEQSRTLIEEGVLSESITAEQAAEPAVVLHRLEQERQRAATVGWEAGELRKAFPAGERTPRAAREAVTLVAADVPSEALDAARVLTTELVTNSVKYGPPAPASIGLVVDVARERIRVEVSDAAEASPQLRSPSTDGGGYGLTLVEALATRWSTSREAGRNVTWFELDLPTPGA